MTQITRREEGLAAVVLAAGQGTRMRSDRAKVLHPVLGRSMAAWPVEAALDAGAARVAVVVGHQADEVREALEAEFPDRDLIFPLQERQNGTGDAVRHARDATEGADSVLILCGDTPALDADTLRGLLHTHRQQERVLTLLTFELDDPTGYGRIVREGGRVAGIVEHKDATEAQRAIREVNAGVYLVRRDLLFSALDRVGADNAQGEVYLTDVVGILASDDESVGACVLDDPTVVSGVNTRAQLAALEGAMLDRLRTRFMEAGVSMHAPETVRIEHGVRIGADTVLGPGVQLLEGTVVGEGCFVEAGCVLRGCTLADGVHLKPYVVAEDAALEDGVVAGPFSHLRPGSVLRRGAKVGNFVETKKTVIGPGSKANHLAYLGDTDVGRDVNVGAGTITCNYDGANKHRTVIEDEVFIGSDTQIVAPARLGKRSTIAAGTTVTRDVPDGALAVSRTRQDNKEGYYERHRRPREEARARAKREGN
ncbi:MAG: bifunctional UDP-N-acetylglucosamine diphosphorylase/glucosamine-1-phosphate N-acetyltransferase GlmU [Myxococcota bacterium]